MNFTTELIVLSIVIILLFIRPNALVKFSKSIIGKVVFVSTIILSSNMNPLIGLFFATLMILLLETSYEGFKEGLEFGSGIVNPINITTFGTTPAGSNEIVLYTNDPTDFSIKGVDLEGTHISPNTLITDKVNTSSIIIRENITYTSSPGDISFVKVDEATKIYDYDSERRNNNNYDINFSYQGGGSSTKAIINLTNVGDTQTSYIVDIKKLSDNEKYKIENLEFSMMNSEDQPNGTIEVVIDEYKRELIKSSNNTNSYLTFKDNEVENTPINVNDYILSLNSDLKEAYKVVDVSNTFHVTLATNTNNDIDHNTPLSIVAHKHHFITYDTSHIHINESFTSYNGVEEKITEVKPYQEPEITFLSDLTGETVCSTNLCDRIDAETKIIFPIFSNNHCPTNI